MKPPGEHDWTGEPHAWACLRCGMDYRALLMNLRDNRYCDGNAYICRVATALGGWFMRKSTPGMDHFTFGMRSVRPGHISEIMAWNMSASELAHLIHQVVGVACNYWSAPYENDTIKGLVKALEDDPTKCPILADALEDAGCQDVELLSALRMT